MAVQEKTLKTSLYNLNVPASVTAVSVVIISVLCGWRFAT